MTHPDICKLAAGVQTLAARWFRNDQSAKRHIVVTGDVGCGKTHCSRALFNFCRGAAFAAWEQHWGAASFKSIPSVEYMDWMEVASPEKAREEQFARWLQDAERSSILILDDVGTETDQYRTGIPTQRLCQLLNRMENKFLWITTNVLVNDWEKKWDRRVADRLKYADVVEINAPSYRSEV